MATPLFQHLLSRRIALVTGKGGVGRTTVAAALAVAAARSGKRTLLLEIEEPVMQETSPLAALFGRDVFPLEPARLRDDLPSLFGARLQSERGTAVFLKQVLKVEAMANLAMRSQALMRLMHAAPSFREMGVFNHLLHYLDLEQSKGTPRYELCLLDMPATGHTLALTGLPEILLRLIPVGPMAKNLRRGQGYLNNPKTGAAFVVTLLEKLPVTESLELIDGLKATHMPLGGVFANRRPEDPFSEGERVALTAMLRGKQVLGQGELDRIARGEEELARLTSGGAAVQALPERPESGPELVDALASALVSA